MELFVFRSAKLGFKHFQVVLSAILIGCPKKTLTAGIRLNDLQCHFSNIHRFVGQYHRDVSQVIFTLFDAISKFLDLSQYLVFGLDDTLVPKQGPKIFGRGCHFDHAKRDLVRCCLEAAGYPAAPPTDLYVKISLIRFLSSDLSEIKQILLRLAHNFSCPQSKV